MASPQALQEAQMTASILGNVTDTLSDEIRPIVALTSHDYVKALNAVGAPRQLVQQYVMNGVESAKQMHALGMKSGQLKKYLEEENIKAVQDVMNQRDQQQIAQMEEHRNRMQYAATQDAMLQSLDQGQNVRQSPVSPTGV